MSRKNSYYHNSFSLGMNNHLSKKIVLDGIKKKDFNNEPIINNIKYNEEWTIWNKMPNGKPKNDFKLANVDPLRAIVDKGTPAFRNKPNAIKGHRNTLECCDKTNPRKKMVVDVYEDTYANCDCDISFNTRSKQPIIRSGMQHKQLPKYLKNGEKLSTYEKVVSDSVKDVATKQTAKDNSQQQHDALVDGTAVKTQAKIDLDTKKEDLENAMKIERSARDSLYEIQKPVKNEYAYSYREYLINKKKTGEERIMNGGKNSCKNKDCWTPKYPGSFQNHTGNGAVTSGLRIANLKLNAIRGSSRCPDDPTKCNGVYFAGKPRWTGWIHNKNHPEINFPQLKAKRRTFSLFTGSGIFEKKIIKNTNDGSCCGGKALFNIRGCCNK
jgi:hypothetical protein